MQLAKQIGTVVRSLRIARRLKQDELASLVGVTERTISQIENGHVTTSLPTLHLIAEQLGVPLWRLFRVAEELHDDDELAVLSEIFAMCASMDGKLLTLVGDLVRAVHAYRAKPTSTSDDD